VGGCGWAISCTVLEAKIVQMLQFANAGNRQNKENLILQVMQLLKNPQIPSIEFTSDPTTVTTA
jgi:hypothetical protein